MIYYITRFVVLHRAFIILFIFAVLQLYYIFYKRSLHDVDERFKLYVGIEIDELRSVYVT